MSSSLRIATDRYANVEDGKKAEAEGNLEKAAGYYEIAIKDPTHDEFPFDRLMIIYRKLKSPKDELRVINQGIKKFEDFYARQAAKGKKQAKLKELSNSFMKTVGLRDKKGRELYQPEPIARWTKRKAVAERLTDKKKKPTGKSPAGKKL